MTHGQIWLPLDPTNPNSQMLFCEAWSDGYLEGVGRGIWCSSKHLNEICQASILFAGQPFFFKPSDNTIQPHSEDYIIEGFEDSLTLESEDEINDLVTSAEETLGLIKINQLGLASHTVFGMIPLETKFELGIGLNAYLSDLDTVWSTLCEDSQVLTSAEASKLLVQYAYILKRPAALITNMYVWKDNQFWCSVNINEQNYVVPLALLFAVYENGKGCYGDLAYLNDLTAEDKYTLDMFAQELITNNIPVSKMLNGQYLYKEGSSPSMD